MIFLVDDDLIQNTITSQLVSYCDASIEYEVYNNGEEVIEALKEGQEPTHILLDINMPIMNGWEFLNLYQNYPKTAKVFILTSSDNDEDLKKIDDFECVVGYYIKPVTKDTIEQILAS